MKKIALLILTMSVLFKLNSCKILERPIFWQDPYPSSNDNAVWIYDGGDLQIYYIAVEYQAFICRSGRVELVKMNFGEGQSLMIRKMLDRQYYYFDGGFRATEEKFWLQDEYGVYKNNLFTEEEMAANPTFYRYDIDALPEDTPQEVMDYIAGPVAWRDPYPNDFDNAVWIYEGENLQVYYVVKTDMAYICRDGRSDFVWWRFDAVQSVDVRKVIDGGYEYYFYGYFRATDEKFWLLDEYGDGISENNLFTEEEMEAEPTFYRYEMDNLPEDTPQEVMDYIAGLDEE